MRASEARALIALLIAAWPRVAWPEPTQRVYADALEQFRPDEGRRAVERLTATSEWPPSVAELRRTIIEDRLGMPDDVEAWELAVAHAAARRPGAPRARCLDCMGDGRTLGGDPCEPCDGTGELDVPDLSLLPPVPDPVPRAAKFVGGWRRIRESERPDLLRRDFTEAYRKLRVAAVERENLVLLGANQGHPLIEAASERAALET